MNKKNGKLEINKFRVAKLTNPDKIFGGHVDDCTHVNTSTGTAGPKVCIQESRVWVDPS